MASSPEPEFELLRRLPHRRGQRLALLAAAGLMLASIAWAIVEHLDLQEARREEALQLSRLRVNDARLPPSRPPYALEAEQAARLIQAPVDDWLRELERCQPEHARTLTLRIDAVQRQVSTTVIVRGIADLDSWSQCLNAGLDVNVWRVTQVTVDEGGGAGPPLPAPLATVTWVRTAGADNMPRRQ